MSLRQRASGAAYSRAIHSASLAPTWSKEGAASTCFTGSMRDASTPSAGSSVRAMTYPTTSRLPKLTRTVVPTRQDCSSPAGT